MSLFAMNSQAIYNTPPRTEFPDTLPTIPFKEEPDDDDDMTPPASQAVANDDDAPLPPRKQMTVEEVHKFDIAAAARLKFIEFAALAVLDLVKTEDIELCTG
jgi:hypothetical protein